ncbi:MAG: endonuclease, partial [Pseudonocardia sp.]|nr:endonuclease [Pseudonocardia sp.]
MPGPTAAAVELTDEERTQLLSWTRRSTSANAVATRSRIVLAAAEGLGNTAVAAKVG